VNFARHTHSAAKRNTFCQELYNNPIILVFPNYLVKTKSLFPLTTAGSILGRTTQKQIYLRLQRKCKQGLSSERLTGPTTKSYNNLYAVYSL